MRSTYFKRALSALGVAATLFQGAFAAPAAGHNVEGRAISKGGATSDKAIMNLWFRGRVFYDIVNKNAYDPLADEPIAGKLLEIGRYIGTSFVSIGSATSIADGTFNIYFSAGPGGNFSIVDSATQKELKEFTWPTDATAAGGLIPIDPPMTTSKTATRTTTGKTTTRKTSTSASRTRTKTNTRTKTKTTTRTTSTVPVCPVYDGKAMPWYALKPTGGSDASIMQVDADSKGNVIFCGYADGKLTLGGKTGGGFGNLVGFVVKMSPNGTVAWAHFVQQTQVSGSAKFSTINNCFFSKDETKVMVTGNSAETTIGLGTLTRTLVGNQDAFIAIINPGTGAVEHLTTMGLASESQYAGTNYARGPANVMYTAFNVKDSTAFSDDSSTITCGAQQDCCFAVKYTGTVRNWAKAVEQSLCDGGVAVSPDGTKLYVSGMTTIYVLDAATGNALSNVTINNVDDIQSLVVAGTNVYAYGPVSSSTTFNSGSVSLLHPQPGSGAYLFRFAISGSTLTPSAATWMGTATSTESGYVTVYNMGSANNVTGNPNSVIVAMSASGSTFKSGSGFSKQFTTTLYGSASYSLALYAVVDGSTMKVTSANVLGAGAGWTDINNKYDVGLSVEGKNGHIYAAGTMQRTRNITSCAWNFNSTWNQGYNIPIVAKFLPTLELPQVKF